MSTKYLFEYLYRDRANFKAYGEIVIDREQLDRIMAAIDEEIYFIPEQVGVPPLQHILYAYSNGPTDQDHEWHEVVRIALN